MAENEEITETTPEITQEQWDKEHEAFMAKYPDLPLPEPIPCLDLIMKREWAEKILTGEKKVEFRDYTEHYAKRMFDKKTLDYIDKHLEDAEFMAGYEYLFSPLRQVETIHFHNYNNTWYLDVEVDINQVIEATQEDADYLYDEYGCDELYEDVEWQNKHPREEITKFFCFIIKDVIDTNLEAK